MDKKEIKNSHLLTLQSHLLIDDFIAIVFTLILIIN